MVAALVGCAGPGAESRWDDPAVHRLRLSVAAEPEVNTPEVRGEAARLRDSFEQALRQHGFLAPDATAQADGVVRLKLKLVSHSPDAWRAGLAIDLPSGEVLDDVRVNRQQPLPQTAQELDAIAQRLVVKLERSARVQTLARTGVLTSPP
jgi:hypothetical protein